MGILYFILFYFVGKLLCGFIQVIVEYYREQKAKKPPTVEFSISVKEEFDSMEGHDFEYFCAKHLKRKGYEKVIVTRGSGDFGVDVLCNKNGKYYGIQCKRQDKPLGNKPVQEVFAGKQYYGCDVAIVLTNNYYTDAAKELARKTDVILWDRYDLLNLIE